MLGHFRLDGDDAVRLERGGPSHEVGGEAKLLGVLGATQVVDLVARRPKQLTVIPGAQAPPVTGWSPPGRRPWWTIRIRMSGG